MKYKVAELDGHLLDAAVAKAEGWDYMKPPPELEGFAPHRSWAVAGPIIERELILVWRSDHEWLAKAPKSADGGYYAPDLGTVDVRYDDGMAGPTYLIAAMRAYVSSKHGETIELS